MATLVNDKQLKLSLYFSYAYEDQISVGQSVDVSIPAVMRTFTGTVEKINKVSYISPEGAVHFEAVVVFLTTPAPSPPGWTPPPCSPPAMAPRFYPLPEWADRVL